jgi:hypothetical protein
MTTTGNGETLMPTAEDPFRGPMYYDRIQTLRDKWYNRTYSQAAEAVPEPTFVTLDDDRRVKTFILEPEDGHAADPSLTLVLAQEFLNGYAIDKDIRARIMRDMIAPTSRLIVLPNNAYKDHAYDLTINEKERILEGSERMKPYGEMFIRVLEKLDRRMPLGDVALSGYSQGANSVIAMAAVGSDRLRITNVNADEVVSKQGRDPKQLENDFKGPDGAKESLAIFRDSIMDANIPALAEAMNARSRYLGLARFGIKSMGKEAQLLKYAMSGSMDTTISKIPQDVHLKIGHMDGSPMFDPESLSVRGRRVIDMLVEYYGDNTYKHASSNNPWTHGLMALHGIGLR